MLASAGACDETLLPAFESPVASTISRSSWTRRTQQLQTGVTGGTRTPIRISDILCTWRHKTANQSWRVMLNHDATRLALFQRCRSSGHPLSAHTRGVRHLDPGVLVLGRTGPAALADTAGDRSRSSGRAVKELKWIAVFGVVEFGIPWYLMATAEKHITIH